MEEKNGWYVIASFGDLREKLVKMLSEQPELIDEVRKKIENCDESIEGKLSDGIFKEEALRALLIVQNQEEEKLCEKYGVSFEEKYKLLQKLQKKEKIDEKYNKFLDELLKLEDKYGWKIR